MLPNINIGPFQISSYAFFAFIGCVAFFTTINLLGRKEGIDKFVSKKNLYFNLIAAIGLIAQYIFALIVNSIVHSIEERTIVIGGITWIGGLLGSLPTIYLLLNHVKYFKGDKYKYLSIFASAILIGHVFGRVGCFFAGCCYGKLCFNGMGVSFPEGSTAALEYPSASGVSLPVYPTQLYEALFDLILFIIIISFRKKIKYFDIEVYLVSYAIFRFLLEFIRGDDRGSLFLIPISPSQLGSIILVGYAITLIVLKKKIEKNKVNPQVQ